MASVVQDARITQRRCFGDYVNSDHNVDQSEVITKEAAYRSGGALQAMSVGRKVRHRSLAEVYGVTPLGGPSVPSLRAKDAQMKGKWDRKRMEK